MSAPPAQAPLASQAPLTFQEVILKLQEFWAERGCVLQQPYDIEVGAGTMNPATFLRALGPEPWSVAYVEPSRRPTDGRYGENPNRLQHYYQYQVILKPSPDDVQDLYLESLKHLGVKGAIDRLMKAKDPKLQEIMEIVQDVQKKCESGWMKAKAVYQFFKARSDGNAMILSNGDGKEVERFEFPRQPKPDGICLADYVRPVGGDADTVCLFVTTAGEGIRKRAEEFKEKGEYVLSHTLQALAIETAEAFAEKLHRDLRTQWGFPDSPEMTMTDRFKSKYQGFRVSPGYPACPELADQEKLWRLLKPEEIGVELTEGHMMDPEASVSALVFHHAQAEYFNASATR